MKRPGQTSEHHFNHSGFVAIRDGSPSEHWSRIAHRLSASGDGYPASYFCDEDRQLGAHLVPLTQCRSVEPVTGERPRSALMLTDYRLFISPGKKPSAANRVCEQLGINPDAWHDAQAESGRLQFSTL